MGSDQVTPPPGFTLDASPHQTEAAPKPPPGFTLDAPVEGSAASRFGSEYWDKGPIANVINLVKGVATHPIDTAGSFVKELVGAPGSARDRLLDQALTGKPGNGSTADRIVTGINAMIPLVGTQMQESAQKGAKGDVAGMLGGAAGIGTSLALPDIVEGAAHAAGPAVRSAMKGTATTIQRQVLKPPKSLYGSDVTGTSLAEGATGSDAGVAKIAQVKQQVGQQLGDLYRKTPQVPTIDQGAVAGALDDLAAKRGVTSNANAGAVQAVRDEFLSKLPTDRALTPSEAFDLKVAHQHEATRMKSGAYQSGADNSAAVAAHQAIADNLGTQLVSQFPEAKALNARYSALSDLEDPLAAAANRAANTAPSRAAALFSIINGVTSGHPMAGVIGSGMLKFLLDPTMRSRVAVELAKASGKDLPIGQMRLGSLLNEAGQATTTPPDPQR